MTPPADPWATIDRPASTVYLGGPDTTAHLGPPGPTAHMSPTTPVPPTAETVRLGDSAPTVRAHNEMRFGPGVPSAPATAPAWPALAPPRRGRPLWRRVVSILSGLLTLALVVVVGLYLWQRLRPIEVQSASVAVPRPPGNRCNVIVDVVATVHTNGRRGVIRYQWFRSDAAPGAVLTEQLGSGQRVATLTLKWSFSGVGATTETATLNITEPSPLQAGTKVAYRCRRG